jgi:hypothetical protein
MLVTFINRTTTVQHERLQASSIGTIRTWPVRTNIIAIPVIFPCKRFLQILQACTIACHAVRIGLTITSRQEVFWRKLHSLADHILLDESEGRINPVLTDMIDDPNKEREVIRTRSQLTEMTAILLFLQTRISLVMRKEVEDPHLRHAIIMELCD